MLLADFGLTLEVDARAVGVDAALLEAAFGAEGAAEDSPSKLLEAISTLAGKRGLSYLVLDRFHDIAIDILARWLDQPCSTTEDWEQRLVVAASLADTRPELWRCVACALRTVADIFKLHLHIHCTVSVQTEPSGSSRLRNYLQHPSRAPTSTTCRLPSSRSCRQPDCQSPCMVAHSSQKAHDRSC
jgi:hypothetical protein